MPHWLLQSNPQKWRLARFLEEHSQQHPDGFVVNAERRPSPRYLILHRTDCTHITRASQQGRWTVAYIRCALLRSRNSNGGRARQSVVAYS